ncbi:hypothetical protein CR513_16848 [Mucuna pruriens]|uniref:Uncharacterized protein n=1 Tax=Mucuna pruriens TaxID=157652 RepID=A0A371HBB3_MUCPR|nr:hypothetical protein CR513_16848 [Mucuna pruriens]
MVVLLIKNLLKYVSSCFFPINLKFLFLFYLLFILTIVYLCANHMGYKTNLRKMCFRHSLTILQQNLQNLLPKKIKFFKFLLVDRES